MNKKIISIGVAVLAIASFANAATLSPSEFAVRQQMIDFAKFFPEAVSRFYPATPTQASPIRLGSVASPDIASPYFSVGGLRQWKASVSLSTTTVGGFQTNQSSTTCSIAAPMATSTVYTSYSFTTLASTSIMEVGWSTGPMATSTLLAASSSVASGYPLPVVSSSTASIWTTFKTFIVPASTRDANGNLTGSFINFKLGGGGFGAFPYPQGTCKATFTETE